jgi:type IV pilus assembly protein PilW
MKKSQGFTLVELMIAVTLGLLLTTALISVFVSFKNVSRTTQGVAGLTDGGRIAIDQLEQAVRGAGYLACGPSGLQRNDLIAGASYLLTDFAEPVSGFEFKGTSASGTFTLTKPFVADSNGSAWATSNALGSSLDSALAPQNGATSGGIVAGSDVIVIHEALPSSMPVYLTSSAAAGSATLSTTLQGSSANTLIAGLLAKGSSPIAAVSNCQSSEIFAIGAANGAAVNFNSTANSRSNLALAFGAGARLQVIATRAFYIGLGADGEGALFVMDTAGANAFSTPVELVPDVESMQVLYGIDTTGGQSVTKYVTADQVALQGVTGDFNSAINLKIAILSVGAPGSAATPASAQTYALLGTSVKAPQDNRLRKVFTTTIALRNEAG